MKVKIEIEPFDGSWTTVKKILKDIEDFEDFNNAEVEVNVTGVEFLKGEDSED